MTTNEIYKQIQIETDACVESKIKTLRLKPRRAYEPQCRLEATRKYQNQLNQEMNENELVMDSIQSKLLAGDNTILITLVIGLAIIFITYYLLFK